MKAERLSGQRGVSVVEAPIVLIVIAFFALGVLGFVQIFIQYQHLTSAARSAARYATKADYLSMSELRDRALSSLRRAVELQPESGRGWREPVSREYWKVCLEPDDEARHIDEVHDGQVERVGEIDETRDLLRGFRRPAAAIEEGIAGQHRHRPAVEAREPGNRRAAVFPADLEEAFAVDDGVHDLPHIVDLAAVARHRLQQEFFAPLQ